MQDGYDGAGPMCSSMMEGLLKSSLCRQEHGSDAWIPVPNNLFHSSATTKHQAEGQEQQGNSTSAEKCTATRKKNTAQQHPAGLLRRLRECRCHREGA